MPDLSVWHARLDVTADTAAALGTYLSADERERAARFHFDRDRRRFLVARGILRSILGSVLGVAPEAVRFRYGARGKPALDAPFGTRLSFNLAHSHELALVALADGDDLGVDIEAIRPLDNALALAERFFAPAERETLRTLPARDLLQGFFTCWTRKEAYVKARGDGLAHPLAQFVVPIAASGSDSGAVFADTPAVGWSTHDVSDLPSYAAAIVVRGAPRRMTMKTWLEP